MVSFDFEESHLQEEDLLLPFFFSPANIFSTFLCISISPVISLRYLHFIHSLLEKAFSLSHTHVRTK